MKNFINRALVAKKKLKLFFALFAMLALGVGNAWGAEAKFGTDWNSVFGTSYSGSISSVKANQLTLSGTVNSVSLVATNGTSTNGYVKTSDWRLYNGYTLTLTAPANHNITAISAKKGGKAIAGISTTVGDLSIPSGGATMSWTGSSNQVVFKVTTTMGFSEITVTYSEGSGSTPTPDPEDPDPENPTPETGGDALSYTWDLSKKTYSEASTTQVTWSATDVNMVVDKASAGTNANNYLPTSQTSSRFYKNSKLTITPAANVTITSVVFTATSTGYASALQGSTWDNASASVSGTTVTVTPTNGASAISATIGGTCGFTGVTVHYTKAASGEPENPTPSVSVAPAYHTFATTNVGETATQEFTITAKNTEATLSASIDNTTDFAIAITGDKVTVTYQPKSAGDHTATMTVKAGEEASTTVALTGKAVAALEGTWILVTDASSLKAGDEIIIAAKESDVALSTTQADNNRPEVAITKNDNTITATSETQVLTLQAGNKENTLALYTGDGYLYAASSGSNWLRTETTLSDNSSWSIAVAADGTATLIAQGTNTRNTLYYNKNSKIFSCYSNAQQPIALYKNTNGKQLAGLAYATTKYLTKLGDAFTTPTLTNPNSLTVTYSSSDNNVATVADDGTITIKAAGVVKITASFAGNSSFLEGSASYTIGVTEHAGTQADPYSVADARQVIDVMETATDVYATGVVSKIVTAYNSTNGNITYNISVDGTTAADQLQAYNGKSYNGANFTSADDIKVGDEVVVKGNLKKHNTTYEFDKENQLVSLNRTKEQAGLAYAETEQTANVGEDFVEPTLTNPNSLSITYSSNNTSLATVDANGEVTILAAGKVTITASTTGNASYAAGSASYNITITDPSLAVATLPFAYNSGKEDIETTAGITQEGLGSDYSAAPKLKFDDTDDYIIIHFNGEPGKLSYDIKGNSYSDGTFTVQESTDGSAYTNIVEYTELGSTETKTHTLAATSRYVKFIYTEKVNGNVALGNIKIALPEEEPEQPGEGGGETPEERLTDWVLTSAADITINDLVVITMTKGETTWAMTNDKGTTAAPVASVVTLSADALAAEPDANLKWVVSNDNGTLTIYPYGTYETWLYCTNTNNGVRVGKGDAKEFTINANYLYTSLTTDPRHIGVYETNNDWRCYKPSSGAIATNIADQTLAFYVKKNANDVLPGTGEDPEGGEGGEDPVVPTPTINPTATFIFNTADGLTKLGITYPATADEDTEGAFKTEFENNATFTQDGITMTTTGGTVVATRVWLTKNGALDLRVYKGATLTFSVPAEHKISAIVFDGSNIGHLLVNGTAVSGNAWTGSEQTVTFTAKADASTIKINTIAFVVEYTRDVTNTYGTICLPYGSTNYAGATFYRVAGKETGKVYLESVDALEAGVPYIFEKTASQIKVTYEGEAVDDPVNTNANGLVGTFTNETVVPEGAYILHQNAFRTSDNPANPNKVNAYRAYLNMANVKDGAPQQMPGRRYIGMSVQGENEATSLDNITNGENTTIKVIENGQLIIIRNGEKFNAQGQRL